MERGEEGGKELKKGVKKWKRRKVIFIKRRRERERDIFYEGKIG